MAVLAELKIDSFTTKSSAESNSSNKREAATTDIPLAEIQSKENTAKPSRKLDHLAQIKSVIGLTQTPDKTPSSSTQAQTQIKLIHINAIDLKALLTWLQQADFNCRRAEQVAQISTTETLIFDKFYQQAVFNFDLSTVEGKKGFWQLLSQMSD